MNLPTMQNSEKSGVGHYLEAVWQRENMIFVANTQDSNNQSNNQIKVDILKRILSTIEFFD